MRSTVLFWVSQYKTYTLIHWSSDNEQSQKQLRMKHTMFKEKLKNWVCSVLHKVLRVWGKRHRDLCCLQYPRRKYRENADTPLLNILRERKKAQDNGQKMQHRKFWLRVKKKKSQLRFLSKMPEWYKILPLEIIRTWLDKPTSKQVTTDLSRRKNFWSRLI